MSTKSGNNNLDFRLQTLNKSAVYFISNNIRLVRCVVLIIHGFGGSWLMYSWLVLRGVSVWIPYTVNRVDPLQFLPVVPDVCSREVSGIIPFVGRHCHGDIVGTPCNNVFLVDFPGRP